jgi:hypothetical protein
MIVSLLGQNTQKNDQVGDRNWVKCILLEPVQFKEPEGSPYGDYSHALLNRHTF